MLLYYLICFSLSYSVFKVHFFFPSLQLRLSPPPPLVGSSGLEPPTSRLSGARSSLLSYEPVFSPSLLASGGDEEIRTLDPLLAGQVLSHLSYTPSGFFFFFLSVPLIEQQKTSLELFSRRVVSSRLLSFLLLFSTLTRVRFPPEASPLLGLRYLSIERR